MERQEKEESEQQSEETPDDAWWLGSMNALTREPKNKLDSANVSERSDKQVRSSGRA